MSLRDDPSYFPQPNVPNDGNYGSSFGREMLYYDYLPKSAAIEAANAAAGEKTYSSGKYTFNPATGQYTWVPAGTVASNLGGNAGAGINAGGDRGGNDGLSSNPGWDALSDAQKAAFYDAHPNFQAVTQFGQKALGFLGLTNPKETAIASGTLGLSGYNNFGKESSIPSGGIVSPGVTANDYAGESGKSSWGKSGSSNQDIGPAAPADGPSGAPPGGGDVAEGGNFGDTSPDSIANGGMISSYAQGGLGSLGGYSDGGRLLRGPGDGVSDSIPATIGRAKQPARLADGEFVVPARIVSELGNGSTEAGARKLYAMLARIQAGRKKSIGTNKVAVNSRMDKHLPA